MNSLQQIIAAESLNETAVLNALQGETNIISDLCVTAADVYGKDCFLAYRWVMANKSRFQEALLI